MRYIKKLSSVAQTAGSGLRGLFRLLAKNPTSAQMHARQGTDTSRALIMSRDHASSAARKLYSTNTSRSARVVDVVELRSEKPVYCLTTECGLFQLQDGGVVVSNCDAAGYPIAYLYPVKKKFDPIAAVRG